MKTFPEWKVILFRENAKNRLAGFISDDLIQQIDLAYRQQLDQDYVVPGPHSKAAQKELDTAPSDRGEIDARYERKAKLVSERKKGAQNADGD